ncbi:ABC transporter ATP-binding protein [Bacillus sp. AGMB 02131]|uniref:ABC transporter ATP-binding protein n=1 Tax=Peribacillus faecalis TaxID=2772559 RepID=A0A927CXZ6_9BACI|nr:ABC transporter ATP-binding protein [Peribacillus faecalis]MBD3107995.1 ABC transporter ATP-binding protein [Peribacillus faecalis]
MAIIQCNDLVKKYRGNKALNGFTCEIKENKITGIIGRNGAGKTTFLKIISGFFQESAGEVKVFGERPFNNLNVSANSIMVDHEMPLPTILKLGEILEEASRFYPNFDRKLAFRLLSYFSLDEKLYVNDMSKGMRSTFHSIIGLSSRCALTIFDEPTLGMDAAVRKDFYRALLKDFIAFPRTVLFSSHHLEEIEDLLEDVLLIDKGKNQLHISIDEMKEWAIAVQGPTEKVKDWTANREVLFEKQLGGSMTYVVVDNNLSEQERESIKMNGLTVLSVSATDLCVYLTNKSKGGIDDVFRANDEE